MFKQGRFLNFQEAVFVSQKIEKILYKPAVFIFH